VYCKLPVAKRNFAKRHRHLGKIPASDLPRDFDDSCDGDDVSTSEQGIPATTTTTTVVAAAAATSGCDIVGDSTAAQPPKAIKKKTTSSFKQKTYRCDAKELLDELIARDAKELREGDSEHPLLSDEMIKRLLMKRQEKWNSLLSKRPKTKKGMITWTQELLRLSEFFDESPEPPVTTATTTMNCGETKKEVKKLSNEVEKEDNSNPSLNLKGKPKEEKVNGDHGHSRMNDDEEDEEDGEIVEKENDDNYDDESDEEAVPDDASTSSEDSVDLRATKKARSS
jgi:hypothetical protein